MDDGIAEVFDAKFLTAAVEFRDVAAILINEIYATHNVCLYDTASTHAKLFGGVPCQRTVNHVDYL